MPPMTRPDSATMPTYTSGCNRARQAKQAGIRTAVLSRVSKLAVNPAVPDTDAASLRLTARRHEMILSPGRHPATPPPRRPILTEMA